MKPYVCLALQDAAGVALRLKVAQRLGILSCKGSRMAVLPAALDDKQPALEGVQVSLFLQADAVCMQPKGIARYDWH
jgi:hypothetical protein